MGRSLHYSTSKLHIWLNGLGCRPQMYFWRHGQFEACRQDKVTSMNFIPICEL